MKRFWKNFVISLAISKVILANSSFWLIHQFLTLQITSSNRTSQPVAFCFGPLVLQKDQNKATENWVSNSCTSSQQSGLLTVSIWWWRNFVHAIENSKILLMKKLVREYHYKYLFHGHSFIVYFALLNVL